jgi:hypothetical protein
MNRILFLFLFCFSHIFLVFSDSFDFLYEDLINFWRIGRQSAFLGISTRAAPYFTGNILDFYIDEYGFFVVVDEINNNRYLTRNGQFTYDGRGFLRNTDGYFVLNTRNEYMHERDIDFDLKIFTDLFLVVIPKDISNVLVSSNYIINSQYITITSVRVCNRLLDTRPFSLSMLLEKAMQEIAHNENFNNKERLISLLYQRYYEMVELDLFTPEEYLELLNNIELFVRELRNKLYSTLPNKRNMYLLTSRNSQKVLGIMACNYITCALARAN